MKNLHNCKFILRLDDVKKLISQLYESMNVKEHQIQKEVELTTQLETLQQEIMPLEEVRVIAGVSD